MSYDLANWTTDRDYDADATSLDELADVLATFIADCEAATLPAYTVQNATPDRVYDADSTSIDELAQVLATAVDDGPNSGAVFVIDNWTETRTLDADDTTIDTFADVLATAIQDFVTRVITPGGGHWVKPVPIPRHLSLTLADSLAFADSLEHSQAPDSDLQREEELALILA